MERKQYIEARSNAQVVKQFLYQRLIDLLE